MAACRSSLTWLPPCLARPCPKDPESYLCTVLCLFTCLQLEATPTSYVLLRWAKQNKVSARSRSPCSSGNPFLDSAIVARGHQHSWACGHTLPFCLWSQASPPKGVDDNIYPRPLHLTNLHAGSSRKLTLEVIRADLSAGSLNKYFEIGPTCAYPREAWETSRATACCQFYSLASIFLL